MLSYLIINTSFGYSGIIFTKNPFFIKKVLLPEKESEKIEARLISESIGMEDKYNTTAKKVALTIQNYFDNRVPIKASFDLLDFEKITDFEKKVFYSILRIPFSETRSYKDIASDIKNPRAARAVGNALAKNPFPIIIPCHRVIRSDGSPGKFGGGTELKKKMIELESNNAVR